MTQINYTDLPQNLTNVKDLTEVMVKEWQENAKAGNRVWRKVLDPHAIMNARQEIVKHYNPVQDILFGNQAYLEFLSSTKLIMCFDAATSPEDFERGLMGHMFGMNVWTTYYLKESPVSDNECFVLSCPTKVTHKFMVSRLETIPQ